MENSLFLDRSQDLILDAVDLIQYYETHEGALFTISNPTTDGGFPRVQTGNDGYELARAIFAIQQEIHDRIFELDNCQGCQPLFEGVKFQTADFLPGAAPAPDDPDLVYNVDINATLEASWGIPVMFATDPVRRPTGLYLPAGTVGKVTTPTSMVNQGFNILVGAHTQDGSDEETIQRFDRVAKRFAIESEETYIANPFGGGIYIEVPYLADLGVVTIQITNAIQSPLYRATSSAQTTLQEWTAVERHCAGPWADFETDHFMMQVPTSWIYNYSDPATQMQNWDLAMNAVSEMLGYEFRNKTVLHIQSDVVIANSPFGCGYPQVSQVYDPDASTDGNSTNPFLTDVLGSHVLYQGLGYSQLMSSFPGRSESIVNLLYAYVSNVAFDFDLTTAFANSLGPGEPGTNMSLDLASQTWTVTENFRNGNPMDVSSTVKNEVNGSHCGFAVYVDIADIFGWQAIRDFYSQEQQDYMLFGDDSLSETDSRILKLSKAAGADLRPLIHFWGVHPTDPVALETEIQTESLPQSKHVYDKLIRYRNVIPMNKVEFRAHYLELYPSQPPGGDQYCGYGWYNHWKDVYSDAHGIAAFNAMGNIINLYFPHGRPEVIVEYPTDETTNANWRTNAALENDSQYGSDGYVLYGYTVDNYITNYDATLENFDNLSVLPSYIADVLPDPPHILWGGGAAGALNYGGYGFLENPDDASQSHSAAVLLKPSTQTFSLTIKRAESTAFCLTLIVGGGANSNHLTDTQSVVIDAGGAGSITVSHTGLAECGVSYKSFNIGTGADDITITISQGNDNCHLTGLAFDGSRL